MSEPEFAIGEHVYYLDSEWAGPVSREVVIAVHSEEGRHWYEARVIEVIDRRFTAAYHASQIVERDERHLSHLPALLQLAEAAD